MMTEEGAQRLRLRLEELKGSAAGDLEIVELEGLLESATIVKPPEKPEEVVFGVRVTLQSVADEMARYRIAGVDETHLEPGNVSWVSAFGVSLIHI